MNSLTVCTLYQTYIPTHNKRNKIPKPEKKAATKANTNSFNSDLVFLLLATSYTKNQAVKNIPMPRRTMVKCGNTAGLTGDTYRDIDSIST